MESFSILQSRISLLIYEYFYEYFNISATDPHSLHLQMQIHYGIFYWITSF